MSIRTTEVYISGTSRGIGKALAERLLKEKQVLKVHGIGRSHSISHARYQAITCDLSVQEQLQALDVFKPSGDVEQAILINNAGMLGPVGAIGSLSNEEILRAVTLNVTAPAVLTNKFLQAYRNTPQTQLLIINVSSGAGKYPVKGWSIYCASKAALDAFSKVVEVDMAANVQVFSVAPGVVDTAMQQEIRTCEVTQFPRVEEFKQMKAEGMLSQPQEVAEKFWKLLAHPEKFAEVLQDVRNF